MTQNVKKPFTERLKKILLYSAALLLLGVTVFGVLYWQTNIVSVGLQGLLNSQLGKRGRVRFSSLRGALISRIRISDLQARLQNVNLSASQVDVGYNPLLLLFGRVKLNHIYIDRLDVEIQAPAASAKTVPQKSLPLDSLLLLLQQRHTVDSLLQALPNLNIRNVQIQVKRIRFIKQPLTIVNANLFLDRLVLSKNNYQIQIRKMSACWQEKNWCLRSLSLVLNGNRDHFTLNRVRLQTDHSQLSLSAFYNLKDSVDINLNLYEFHLGFADLYALSGRQTLKDGALHGTMTLSGSPAHFRAQADLQGFWQDKQLKSLQADLAYNFGKIELKKLYLNSNGGELSLVGTLSQFKKAQALLKFSRLNPRRFRQDAPRANLNGSLDFTINNLNLARADGKGRLQMQASQIDSVPIRRLNFSLSAYNGNFEILTPSFIQLTKNCRFNLEGRLSRKRQIDWTLSTFDNQLSELGPLFGLDSVQGKFDGRFHAMGNLFDPDVSGNLWAPHFGFNNISLDSISLQMYAQNIFSARKGEADFEIKKGKLGKLPVNHLLLKTRINGQELNLDKIKFVSKGKYLNATARIRFLNNQTLLDIPKFKALYRQYWLENDDTLTFTLDSTALTIEQFRLKGPRQSAVELTGFWDLKSNDLQTHIRFDHIKMDPFQQFWQKKFRLKGIVDGTMDVLTPLTDPDIEMDITLDSLRYNGLDLGKVHSAFSYANGLFFLQEINMQRQDASLKVSGNLAFSLKGRKIQALNLLQESQANLNLVWKNVRIGRYRSLLKSAGKISGLTSGFIKLRGRSDNPKLKQYIRLEHFRYNQFTVDSLQAFASYEQGLFRLDRLNGNLNGTPFDMNGWMKYRFNLNNPDGNPLYSPMRLNLHSRGNRISFIGLLNDQVESILGDYEMEIGIGGTPGKPCLTDGMIRLENGKIILSRIRDPLKDVWFDATIADSVLLINRFSAYSPKEKDWLEKSWQFVQKLLPWSKKSSTPGLLNVNGRIDLSDLQHPAIDLKINTDELYADYFVENAAVMVATDNLTVSGSDTLFISGDVTIPRGRFELDLSKMKKNAYLSEGTATLNPPYTAILLDVHLPGNFLITSSPLDLANNFKINIGGDLQAIMEPGSDDLELSGRLDVRSGKYSAWNQNFEVSSGSIDFQNPKEINPVIDLTAVKKVDNRLFELIISGKLSDLHQDVRVTENGQELELSYLDKISLLTLGADLTQLTTNTASTLRNVGEDVATTTALTAVERGAEKVSGLDKVEINSNRSLLNLEKMRLNNGLEDASISFGKYLTNDLYIEYRTQFGGKFPTPQLSWQAGNRIGLQYRISRDWSLDSYYEKTDKGNNKVRIGLSWEYTF